MGLLGDHKSHKKSQYNDFSRKVQFGEVNLKQLLVIKTLESVKSLPCTSPCYTVGKGTQTCRWTGAPRGHLHTHRHTNYCRIIAEGTLVLIDFLVSRP